MRISLTSTVIVSLALHIAVVGGVAFSYYGHFSGPRIAKPLTLEVEHASVAVTPVKDLPAPAPVHVAAASATPPVATTTAPIVPSPTPQKVASIASAKTAPEINPNAHVPVLPPEAVLSPTPPPALNGQNGVVFILDVSGSMYEPYAGATRLAFARAALARQVSAMKDGTPFAIVLYAFKATASGPLVAANDATRDAAVRFLQRDVDLGGGTNLPAGFTAAAQLRTGRLVVATDGDLNTSSSDLLAQTHDILGDGNGPTLSILGIGPRPGTTANHLLQNLADQQQAVYVVENHDGPTPLLTSAAGAVQPSSAQ